MILLKIVDDIFADYFLEVPSFTYLFLKKSGALFLFPFFLKNDILTNAQGVYVGSWVIPPPIEDQQQRLKVTNWF